VSVRVSRRLRCLLLVCCAAWGLFYIERTSIILDGERTFLLWDDAMISMRYARNLANGDGLVWNPGGERVQGISNPGVTFVMAALHLLPLPVAKMALAFQLVSLALLGLCLWLSAALAEQLSGEPAVGLAAALALALWAPFPVWALQGADTAAATACALTALVDVARAERAGTPWPVRAFVWLALGLVVRLDAAVGAAVIGSAALLRRSARPAALAGLALGVATLAGMLAFGELYYGDPLPNTYYLKATGTPRELMLRVGVVQTIQLLLGLSWPVAAAVLLGLAWGLWRGGAHRVVALFAGATLAYDLWVGGDWTTGLPSRFAIPAFPALFCLVLAGLWQTKWLHDGRGTARWGVVALAGVAIGLLASSGQARSDWYGVGDETLFKSENRRLLRAGHYLRQHSAEGTSVALQWAGTTAYFAERPAVDVLGKSDRHIARLVVDRFAPGHSKWDWSYVIHALRPDVILDVSRGLAARSDFRKGYLLATTSVRGEPLHFFVRRGAEGRIHDAGVVFSSLLVSGKPTPPARQAPPGLAQPSRTRQGAQT
jgi:arabinofuranosyltransferase